MESKDKITIDKLYLEKAIDKVGQSLVSQVMKRFEMYEDKETVKDATKELIYENLRDLKYFIEIYNAGVNFVSMPKDN